jgi:hypothetical protein
MWHEVHCFLKAVAPAKTSPGGVGASGKTGVAHKIRTIRIDKSFIV